MTVAYTGTAGRLALLGLACATLSFGAQIYSTTSVLGGVPLTDFEGFAEGTLMLSQVSGVTFGQTPLAGRPQIDNLPFLFGFVASSGTGVLTGSTEGGYSFPTVAGLTITFTSAVQAAEVYLSDSSPLGNYSVQAFDPSNNLLDSFVVSQADLTAAGRYVGFQFGTAQIGRLVIGPGTAANDAFAIDDLRVVSGSGVPEPGTYALMLGSLAMIALRRRSKS